jgi:dTDP-4-dehydrorhamnose 3,5-epimerase
MSFEAVRLDIPDVILVRPPRHDDPRGYFRETYRAAAFREIGIDAAFVQDNEAFSARRGTIRGLHFQTPPHAQAKLVRVLQGAILDVAVDLRARSASFGHKVAVELTASGGEQLFAPRGFAHGYCTLEPNTKVAYKCDAYYAAGAEGGILFSDPALGIDWPFSPADLIVSDKDSRLPPLKMLDTPFRQP